MANLNDIDVIFLGSDGYKKLAELIELEYCLKIYDHIFPDFVSFTSKKVVIESDKGVYFLKEKPSYCSDENKLIFAANYQNFLSTQLDFVPEIVKTEKGYDYIIWQGRFFFLTKYIPGRIYNGSLSDIRLILESLKKYTKSKSEFVEKEKRKESYEIIVPIERVNSGNLSKVDLTILKKTIGIRDKIIADYKACEYYRYDNAHGDFSLFNLILSNEKVLALNDFDNASVLPRMQDFAEFLVSASLINYLAPLTNLKLPIYTKPDKEKFCMILHYYVHEMSFTSEDLNFLSVLVELVWFDIVTLAVIKGDYELSNLELVLCELENNSLRSLVQEELKKTKNIYIGFNKCNA